MSDIAALVSIARDAHELLCLDSCVITRPTAGALNTTTGQYTSTSATVYSGACRVEVAAGSDATTTPAEVQRSRHQLTLPWSAAASVTVLPGDRVAVTSTDPRVQGRTLTVVSEQVGSTASARRFVVELVA